VDPDRYEAEAVGDVEDDDGVLVIRRIEVTYRIALPPEHHDTARRVHGFHARACPVARSLEGAIEIETKLELTDA
jgi:organic hydroperoxide reductase OsmC/OhrA